MKKIILFTILSIAILSCDEPCKDHDAFMGMRLALNFNMEVQKQVELKLSSLIPGTDEYVFYERQKAWLEEDEENLKQSMKELRRQSSCL